MGDFFIEEQLLFQKLLMYLFENIFKHRCLILSTLTTLTLLTTTCIFNYLF